VYVCRGSTHGSVSAEISNTGKCNACLPASGHATPFPSATAPSSPLRAAPTQADTPSQAAACSPQQLPVSFSSSSSSLSLIQVLFPQQQHPCFLIFVLHRFTSSGCALFMQRWHAACHYAVSHDQQVLLLTDLNAFLHAHLSHVTSIFACSGSSWPVKCCCHTSKSMRSTSPHPSNHEFNVAVDADLGTTRLR
jgi:hypothetical protein